MVIMELAAGRRGLAVFYSALHWSRPKKRRLHYVYASADATASYIGDG
jgi:hypothetical protein